MPSILSEVFGTRFFATIYSFTCTSPALGSLLLSDLLASEIYGSRGTRHGDPEDTCVGTDCFRLTFYCVASMAALCLLMSLAMTARTRHRYKAIHTWLSTPSD